jgi:hypothetical protein
MRVRIATSPVLEANSRPVPRSGHAAVLHALGSLVAVLGLLAAALAGVLLAFGPSTPAILLLVGCMIILGAGLLLFERFG